MNYQKMWYTKLAELLERIETGAQVEKGKYDSETYHFVTEAKTAQAELNNMVAMMLKEYEGECEKLQGSITMLGEIHALEDEISDLQEENRKLKAQEVTLYGDCPQLQR